jgi:hypothetical protein
MIRHLAYTNNEFKPKEHLVVGQEYWAYIAEVNSKYTGFSRHVKPFSLTLTKLTQYDPRYWSFTDYGWDFSNCKKKMRQPDAELYYSGVVCDTKEECIESYNKFMDDTAKNIKSSLSYKYNNEFIKGITDGILKNKIK